MPDAMLFESRKDHDPADALTTQSDRAATGFEAHWRAWRRSAQKVTRAWNAWLAADGGRRGELYHRLACALAEEERAAAEVERACAARSYLGG